MCVYQAFTTVGVNDCLHLLSPYQHENYQNIIQYYSIPDSALTFLYS